MFKMVRRSTLRKVLSTFMAVILLLSSTAAVSAVGKSDRNISTSSVSSQEQSQQVEQLTIVAEQEDLRGEYEKHFLMSDGTVLAVAYEAPVHYLDEETGAWHEIDNTLQATVTESGETVYNNRDGLFDVSFAGAATVNRPLVTLQSNGHSIAWRVVTPTGVVNPSEVMSTVVVPEVASATVESDATEQENSLQAVRNIGKIRYTELLGLETEVRLTVTPLKVKEDILLESAPAQSTSYTTRLTLSAGLIPVLGEDGTVFVRDTAGVDVFRIAAPYMTDAVEEISQEIDVSLSAVGSDWELTVTPNWDWLTDSARVYPVTIDPTVYASNNATNTWDTYIYQNCTSSTTASRQDLDRMYVGNRSSASQLKCRGMVKFLTMPTIYGDIAGAQLSFTTPSGTTTWKNMTLYRITESWECSTAAWPGPAATAIQNKAASNGKYTFDVTTAIKAMYYNNSAGTVGNYGFQIRYQDETVSDYNSLRSSEWWTDTEDDASKPYLAITYTAYSPCSFASGGIYHITNVASEIISA